eukprot:CAMPEP_0184692384 /NCGR_PEP_ID=MMETSP0313-20130426/890_1 /TAXON_ID=2792 /ORGANISM="Porphyridium aerugineum, Strain SAG 1380-2" /LENGTH=393 /DNA_ID=CAMNT_0027150211 /DNA_START=123 /DNA_END=1304 /DNA_ORIENTATION=+
MVGLASLSANPGMGKAVSHTGRMHTHQYLRSFPIVTAWMTRLIGGPSTRSNATASNGAKNKADITNVAKVDTRNTSSYHSHSQAQLARWRTMDGDKGDLDASPNAQVGVNTTKHEDKPTIIHQRSVLTLPFSAMLKSLWVLKPAESVNTNTSVLPRHSSSEDVSKPGHTSVNASNPTSSVPWIDIHPVNPSTMYHQQSSRNSSSFLPSLVQGNLGNDTVWQWKGNVVPALQCELPDKTSVDLHSLISKAKANLLILCFNDHAAADSSSRESVDSWKSPFLRQFGDHHDAQCFEILMFRGWFRHLHRALTVASVVKEVPSTRHGQYLSCCSKQVEYLRGFLSSRCPSGRLGSDGSMYSLLVNNKGEIEWMSQGMAHPRYLIELSNIAEEMILRS